MLLWCVRKYHRRAIAPHEGGVGHGISGVGCRRQLHPDARRVLVAVALVSALAGSLGWTSPVRGTPYFWVYGFERQWQTDEAIIPGFWGPLQTSTARYELYEGYEASDMCPTHPPPAPPGVAVACAGTGHSGQRTVQYFDKGRMEGRFLDYTKPGGLKDVFTNGLLVVELEHGQVQTGDSAFEQRTSAAIAIAGDPGNPGPTYADLAALPTRDADTGVTLPPYVFDPATCQWTHIPHLPASIPTPTLTVIGMGDPGGVYYQNVLTAFADFIYRLHGGVAGASGPTTPDGFGAVGWPISPLFLLTVPINGVPTVMLAQAFERRILTYTQANAPEQRVGSTDIGRDYYTWRYGVADPQRYGPPAIAP